MIVTALLVFAGLLAAWILAPTEASTSAQLTGARAEAHREALAEAV